MVHYPPIFRLEEDVVRRTTLLRNLEQRLTDALDALAAATPADEARCRHQVKFWTIDVERGRKRLATVSRHLRAAKDQLGSQKTPSPDAISEEPLSAVDAARTAGISDGKQTEIRVRSGSEHQTSVYATVNRRDLQWPRRGRSCSRLRA